MVAHVKRTVRVKTTQHTLPDLPPVEEYPMREWSIEIVLLDQDNKEIPLTIAEKIIYHLHPTFNNPNRTFTEAPFKITEQGWGGFALNISIFLLDKGGERKITHDLNFLKDSYEVDHVIQVPVNINKPHLMTELAKSGLVPSEESLNSTKRKAAVIASANTADIINGVNEPKPKKVKVGGISPMVKGSIDIERLAFGLTKLKDDYLVDVVHMITSNVSPDMNITNNIEEGEFTMDLFTLPEPLLKKLWEFVKTNTERKDNKKEQEKGDKKEDEKEVPTN